MYQSRRMILAQKSLLVSLPMMGLTMGLLAFLTACAQPHKAESWDQENLKKHDVGCPTAIFIAPNGNLEQCL